MIEDQLGPPDITLVAANYVGQERIAIEQALAAAAQIPREDQYGQPNSTRERAYFTIAESIVRAGDFDRALAVTKTYDVPARQINSTSLLTARIAEEQVKRGDFQSAVANYHKLDDHKLDDQFRYRQNAARAIAQGLARSGDTAGALRFSSSIEDIEERVAAEYAIAATEGSESALWKKIEQEINGPENSLLPARKQSMITDYARERAEVGDVETARAALETITDVNCQLKLHLTIARAEGPNSPEWDKLVRAFEEEGPTDRLGKWLYGNDYQQELVAVAMAETGNEARAREFAHSENEYDDTRNTIAVSLAVGDIAGAQTYLTRYRHLPLANQFAADSYLTDITKAKVQAGRIAEAEADIRHMAGTQFKISVFLAKANHAAEQLDALGVLPETIADTLPELPPNISAQQARTIGAYTIDHWRHFKNYDSATFSRLAHGAAEIAHAYMSDTERVDFIRTLGDEFRRFRDQGMFDDGKHQIVLRHLSEAMVAGGDAGTTSIMLETLYANMGEATGLRLIKSMVESGNAKAGAAGIEVLANVDTPDHAYQYLLNKLAATGYIDKQLPETIINAQALGFPATASRKILQTLYNRLGIQLDADLLEWVAERMYGEDSGINQSGSGPKPNVLPPGLVMESLDAKLDGVIDLVAKSLSEFETLTQPELFERLSSDSESRTLYFMLYGGRTNYSLIQHYNLGKFSQAIAKGAEIEQHIDPALIATKLWDHAPDGWRQAMQQRTRPSDTLVWQTEVGSSSQELRSQARQELRDVFGAQLSWLLSSGAGAKNFGELPDALPLLDPKLSKKVEALLGEHITAIFTGSEQDITIGDFEKLKNNMLSQIRQARQTAKQQKDQSASAWADILTRAQAEDPVLAMRHILALVSRDPSRSLHPTGADAEWLGHVTGLSTTIRESQRTSTDSRTLTVRYLDGKEDFAQLLRFADGAQCCFTSENTIGVEADPGGGWRMRINRDPHWFVFSIEDTPPDAMRRRSTGFVFGSLAEVDGSPALAINGIYMQRKTDSAANTVLNDIVERFAKPLGVHSVVVATKYGGNFNIDRTKWEPAGGHSLFRPRAIVDDIGDPETTIYDDLGTSVNTAEALDNLSWRQIIQ